VKNKPKEPPVPQEVHDTTRKALLSALGQGPRSAKELSAEIGIAEKEVYDHLEHLARSLNHADRYLLITPAECKKCGFVFSKRERLKKPGKCPVCKGESIHEPLFEIQERN